jgi:hypothetical protein
MTRRGHTPLENSDLISFAEAKKLVVYPMLLAQFVGIVHEVTPKFLKRDKKYRLGNDHLHPALITLGNLTPNARDIMRSFKRRKYKITVAESFDIRLSAAARGLNLSPFVGTVSELLQASAKPQVSSDGDFEGADGVEELSAPLEVVPPPPFPEMSDAEIPF